MKTEKITCSAELMDQFDFINDNIYVETYVPSI